MNERLLSVGLDVGTTSTQFVLSELEIQNQAGAFSVPQLEITKRELRYCSPVYFTPLLSGKQVDGQKIRQILEREYEKAGITRADVDTGAVIITGETSRKENAAAVLEALSDYAGDFVVATPDLRWKVYWRPEEPGLWPFRKLPGSGCCIWTLAAVRRTLL